MKSVDLTKGPITRSLLTHFANPYKKYHIIIMRIQKVQLYLIPNTSYAPEGANPIPRTEHDLSAGC